MASTNTKIMSNQKTTTHNLCWFEIPADKPERA